LALLKFSVFWLAGAICAGTYSGIGILQYSCHRHIARRVQRNHGVSRDDTLG
jgi:hypothetical protein